MNCPECKSVRLIAGQFSIYLFVVFAVVIGCPFNVILCQTVAHWQFEGEIAEDINEVTDIINGKVVHRLEGKLLYPDSALVYDSPIPIFGLSSSSHFANTVPNANNNGGICLIRPDDDDLDFAGAEGFTVEAFVRPTEIRQAVIARDYGGSINSQGWWLDMTIDADFTFHLGSSSLITLSSGADTVTLGDWQHVAGTWDGSTMRIYIDGIEANSALYSAGLIDNTGAFGIGAIVRWAGSQATVGVNEGQYFKGNIDELRLSDTALDTSEFLNAQLTQPYVLFSEASSSAMEDSLYAQIDVEMVGDNDLSASVHYRIMGGSATSGEDYILSSGSLIFAPHQSEGEIIDVLIFDDDLVEGNEDVIIELYNPVNCVSGYNNQHTFAIFDDESLPEVGFETDISQSPESQSPAQIAVVLSEPIPYPVFVDYSIVGGSAVNGVDYYLDEGTLEFAENQTTQFISIEIINDSANEGDETIELELSNPSSAILGSNWRHTFNINDTFVNSLGMEFAVIRAGSFEMGSTSGDFDEEPIHSVTITEPFHMALTEVTNAQYEQFDPNHALIDHRGFTHEPNEAVIFINWADANAFCEWLSDLEGLPYRLPTEAEWEYACRAGTTTEYYPGNILPAEYYKNQVRTLGAVPVDLTVAQTPANTWGLYDMHGNVEEWCRDWYGPYDANDQADPVGRIDGDFKVSRGGSHSTTPLYLRSANRIGTVPQDNHWLLGFRVVMADLPQTKPVPVTEPGLFQLNVSQEIPADIYDAPDPTKPYFYGPRRYVWIPAELDGGPLFHNHNHVPGLVQCPNGDMLAVWYSTISERGRELAGAVSRLRYGADEWEDASVFWNAPDRNDHSPALWADETGRLYHFQGLGTTNHINALATIMRTSTDNGVTWSKAKLIITEHNKRHMPIESMFRLSDGKILLPCDAVHGGNGGTAVFLSDDNGQTWYDLGAGQPDPVFSDGGTGAWIAGIHAPVVELGNGNLLSYGRGDNINDMMPKSISADGGYTWTYSASIFPPISSGKRAVMITLKEGPIFFASFGPKGLFGCVSYDDGATWTPQRLITDDGPARQVESTDGSLFTLSATSAEPRGYLSVWQAKNNLIHLISSREHYVFNLKHIDSGYEHPIVDGDDLELFSGQWLSFDPNSLGNLDDVAGVNLKDYSIFSDYWLEPEPANWPLNE